MWLAGKKKIQPPGTLCVFEFPELWYFLLGGGKDCEEEGIYLRFKALALHADLPVFTM